MMLPLDILVLIAKFSKSFEGAGGLFGGFGVPRVNTYLNWTLTCKSVLAACRASTGKIKLGSYSGYFDAAVLGFLDQYHSLDSLIIRSEPSSDLTTWIAGRNLQSLEICGVSHGDQFSPSQSFIVLHPQIILPNLLKLTTTDILFVAPNLLELCATVPVDFNNVLQMYPRLHTFKGGIMNADSVSLFLPQALSLHVVQQIPSAPVLVERLVQHGSLCMKFLTLEPTVQDRFDHLLQAFPNLQEAHFNVQGRLVPLVATSTYPSLKSLHAVMNSESMSAVATMFPSLECISLVFITEEFVDGDNNEFPALREIRELVPPMGFFGDLHKWFTGMPNLTFLHIRLENQIPLRIMQQLFAYLPNLKTFWASMKTTRQRYPVPDGPRAQILRFKTRGNGDDLTGLQEVLREMPALYSFECQFFGQRNTTLTESILVEIVERFCVGIESIECTLPNSRRVSWKRLHASQLS